MIDVSKIEDWQVDDLVKGFPHGAGPMRLAEIGAAGWSVLAEDLALPACVLKRSAIEGNARWMAAFLAASGAILAPHGKTTMSPQLFAAQLEQGAWAITVATVSQLAVCRRFGVERVVLANQLVGRRAIGYVLDELARDPAFDLYCLVDSAEGVGALARAAAAHSLERPVQVLLEVGVEGRRSGCRDLETALAVAEAVDGSAGHLALRGVEGFEGLIHAADEGERERRVAAFLDLIAAVAERCARAGLFADGPVILSAGGSAYYDLVAERLARVALGREHRVVTRSGCYLSHDSAMYERAVARLRARSALAESLGEPPRAALELWAYIQSRPEPGRAIATLGRRDCSHDAGLPRPLAWYRPGCHERPEPIEAGCECLELNDQHAYLAVPASSPLAYGDLVAFGISHPCTTFDRWRLVYLVDDDYRVSGAIRTFF